MKTTLSRKRDWPRKVTVGRASVNIYKRTAPNGSPCFMVANYSTGKRRFDSYPSEAEAIEAAGKLARQMSEQQVLAAAMTNDQAGEYAAAVQKLAPFGIGLLSAADAVADTLRIIGGFKDIAEVKTAAAQGKPLPDLASVREAGKLYRSRQKLTTSKRVSDVVAELLTVKQARGASARYLQDLRSRLNRFAADFQKDIGNVTTADVQGWLDRQKKLAPQTHTNFRRVIFLLFKFAKARGYCLDNVIDEVERVKVRNGGKVEIYTPAEIARLLAAAPSDFRPCVAIGAFAGLRSAEIERLAWSDVDLAGRHIIVGADAAKTASRRVVPVSENLAQWLALTPASQRKGKIWKSSHDDYYDAQQATADATGADGKEPVKWKANALRHSFASYLFALTNDAGRVAGFCGNSPAVIHRHYRELVKPADGLQWFNVRPDGATGANALPQNLVTALPAATATVNR